MGDSIDASIDPVVSPTEQFQVIRCTTRNFDVLLVDTPGFDHSGGEDAKMLKDLADWLEETLACSPSTIRDLVTDDSRQLSKGHQTSRTSLPA
jgi:hypothetical protein